MNRTQLLQLSADLDRVIQFGFFGNVKSAINARRAADPEVNAAFKGLRRVGKAIAGPAGIGAGFGALVGGVGGAMSDDPDSSAIGGAFKGAAIGGSLGVGAGAASGAFKNKIAMQRLARMKRGAASRNQYVPPAGGMMGAPMLSAKTENLLTLSAELDDVVEFGRGDIFKKMTGGHAVPRPPKGHTGEFYESAGKRYRIDTPALQAQDLSEMREMMPGSKYRFGNKRMLREAPYRNLSAELDQVINFDFMSMVKKYGPAVGKSALKWGGIGAAGGAVAGGVSGALSDDPNKTALGGALGGAAAGGLLGAAGGAGMRGMKINSAINKAAGMKAARLAGTPGAAAAPSAAAAPTATAAAAPAAAVSPQVAGTTTHGSSAYANTSVADALAAKRAAASASSGLPAGVRPRGADELRKPMQYSSRLQSLVQLSADLDQVLTTQA